MSRSIDEWVGKSDDAPIPPRVKVRQYLKDNGICQCGCTMGIRPGDIWETDHIIAIVNGGENRESNLQTLLKAHHQAKTKADVAEKSVTARKRTKHLGIKKPRTIRSWRRFDGTVVYADRER